jgi:PncC family amidohydrolase
VIAYVNEAKERLLGVPRATLIEHGAVSEPVAAEMARGVARALGADCGIGISGIAGPAGGTETKPVGTVCFAACTPEGSVVTTRLFSGDREAVRRRSGQAAIVQLLRMLEASG